MFAYKHSEFFSGIFCLQVVFGKFAFSPPSSPSSHEEASEEEFRLHIVLFFF